MSWFNIIKKLSGNQHRIDANKDGKITAEDFRQLREESDDTEKLAPLAAAAGAAAIGARRLASKLAPKKKKGSGTTAEVAMKMDKKWVGIELNPDYIEIAKSRLKPTEKEYETKQKAKEMALNGLDAEHIADKLGKPLTLVRLWLELSK